MHSPVIFHKISSAEEAFLENGKGKVILLRQKSFLRSSQTNFDRALQVLLFA